MMKSALFTVRNNEPCLKCEAEPATRFGKRGLFLGCSQCPVYDYVRLLKSSADGHIVKVLEGQARPARDANLVLRQEHFGMFIGCSNYPEYEYTELTDKPDETVIMYPQCRAGHLAQRRSRYGKTFHPCDYYLECQFAINFKPIAGEYPEYRYPLLTEKKIAQGVKHFCTDKQCGEPILVE